MNSQVSLSLAGVLPGLILKPALSACLAGLVLLAGAPAGHGETTVQARAAAPSGVVTVRSAPVPAMAAPNGTAFLASDTARPLRARRLAAPVTVQVTTLDLEQLPQSAFGDSAPTQR